MLCNSKSGFPVFDSVEHVADDSLFVICGGGGSAKSGVANRVSLCTLGPRSDGHAGVSLVQLANFNTEARLATSCCMINATTVAFAIETEVTIAERSPENGDTLIARHQEKVNDAVEILRYCHRWLMVGTAKGHVLAFEWTNGTLKKSSTLMFHLKSIVDIWPGPGSIVATASADDTIRIWNMETGKPEHILPANSSAGLTYRRARFSVAKDQPTRLFTLQVPKNRKGASFVVVWQRRQVQQKDFDWEIRTIQQVSPLLVTAMTVSADGKYVAVGSADLSVSVLDQTTLAPLRVIPKVHGLPVTGMFFRGSYVVSASADATCAMVRIDDIGAFDISKTIRTCFSFLAMLVTLLMFLIVTFVARNVEGSAARMHFWDHLVHSSAPLNLSMVDTDSVSKFMADFLWKE